MEKWYNGIKNSKDVIAIISGGYNTLEITIEHLNEDREFGEKHFSKNINPWTEWVSIRNDCDDIVTARQYFENNFKGKHPTCFLAGKKIN
jgi:hypothetical protein